MRRAGPSSCCRISCSLADDPPFRLASVPRQAMLSASLVSGTYYIPQSATLALEAPFICFAFVSCQHKDGRYAPIRYSDLLGVRQIPCFLTSLTSWSSMSPCIVNVLPFCCLRTFLRSLLSFLISVEVVHALLPSRFLGYTAHCTCRYALRQARREQMGS